MNKEMVANNRFLRDENYLEAGRH